MDVLARAAVAEISQLISESSADLRLEISRSIKENEVLRTRMKVMKSELFALRLQKTNATRAGRFSFSKALCRPRSRLAVVDKIERHGRSSPITITEDERHPTTNKIESTDVESSNCPDVILIKEEDGPEVNFRQHADQAQSQNEENVAQSVAMGMPELNPSSLMLGNEGPCIVSVHSGEDVAQGPAWAAPENSSPFTQPDPQRFPSLAPIHTVNHGTQSQQSHDASRTQMTGMQGSGEAQRRGGASGNVDQATTLAASTEMTPTSSNLSRYEGWQLGLDVRTAQHHQSPLACSFCDKRFYRRSDLARHRTIHTGEVPITCHLCGKQFVNKTTLNVHMRIHTGEKPFVCSLCGKSFTQNGSLKIHMRTHSGEKPYGCSHCGANFNNPSNLRRHMVTHTDEGNMAL
ncbi:zinc finger protein 2-like isoform X1 [Osmerus mordax]|uniref:zinc finger protein 2-like isoform X1 n=1 Tax=Osmerus mordax TaxID=8014 RepID=UPI00350EE9EE